MACPADLVLFVLCYQTNALKNISNIVYSSLLYLKLGDSLIQVNALFRGIFDKLDELFCQLNQSVFLPCSLSKQSVGLVVDIRAASATTEIFLVKIDDPLGLRSRHSSARSFARPSIVNLRLLFL